MIFLAKTVLILSLLSIPLGLINPSAFGFKAERFNRLRFMLTVFWVAFISMVLILSVDAPSSPRSAETVASSSGARATDAKQTAVPSKADPDLALMRVPEMFEAYCQHAASRLAIIRQTEAELGVNENSDRVMEERLHELSMAFEAKQGVPSLKVAMFADAHDWQNQCNAKAAGRGTIGYAEAQAVSSSDASRIADALQIFYYRRVKDQARPMFSGYGTAICEYQTHARLKFIGCQMKAMGRLSDWAYFATGRKDGRLMVAPMNGPALAAVNGERIIPDVDNNPVQLAAFSGVNITAQDLRAEFE
jgi:hypothetical protein